MNWLEGGFRLGASVSDKMILFRGSLLNPINPARWVFHADAGMLVHDGRIVAVGPIERFEDFPAEDLIELDGLLIPGMVDVHIHWVQHHVRGRFQDHLLQWLRESIWPEEAAFAEPDFAVEHAHRFFADTLRAGTTMGMAYSSAHVEALRAAGEAMRGDWVLGNVLMPECGPDDLCAASQATASEVATLVAEFGRHRYAITPRFALNCNAPFLRDLGELARRSGAFVQTHLAESKGEIEEVMALFPDALDYTDVYDRAGLLSPRAVLGHCIHLSDRELDCLSRSGSWIAHCPSSNEALDSGRMDLTAIRRHRIRFALASDVGAGPSHSMLHVMQRFMAQHLAAGESVTIEEALYRSTLAGADCLGRKSIAGNFEIGKRADFVLMPRTVQAAPPDAWMMELCTGSVQELENRPLGTWIAGECVSRN